MTGATGLLGPALVRELRRRSDRSIVALVRDPDRAPRDVETIVGDLARPWLGLDEAVWARLAARLGTIVHAGARIALPLDWDAHAATNVDGTAWIARLAHEAGAELHHVSTLAVFVGTDRAPGRCGREQHPERAATAFGGYAQTKIAAEAIARARGARICRLGLLVADAPRDGSQLAMIAHGLAKLDAAPHADPALRFDVTRVDDAARAIAELAPGTHHVAGRSTSFAELVAALGLPTVGNWAERARALIADPDVGMAYLALARLHGASERTRAFDLFLATGMDFDSPPPPAFDVVATLRGLA